MKRFSHKIWVFVLLSVAPLAVYTQAPDAKQVLQNMARAYSNLTEFSVDVTYSLYGSHSTSELIQQNYGYYHKKDSSSLTNYQGAEVLLTPRYSLTILESEKTIYWKNQFTFSYFLPLPGGLDSIHRYLAELKASTQNDGSTVVEMVFPNVFYYEYDKIEVVVESSSNRIKTLKLYYKNGLDTYARGYSNQPARMEISYRNFTTEPNFTANHFSETRFIKTSNGTATGVGKYLNYSIIKTN